MVTQKIGYLRQLFTKAGRSRLVASDGSHAADAGRRI